MKVDVAEALKSLDGTFLARDIRVQRSTWIVDRRGNDKELKKIVTISVVDFHELGLMEVKTLVRIFKVFKQTLVKNVEVEKCKDGIRITFARAVYTLKGIEDG